MAKAMLVTLPLILLLLDFWPLGRWNGKREQASISFLLLEKAPLLALSAGAAVLAWIAQSGSGAVVPLAMVGFSSRVANAAVSTVRYLAMTFRPVDLTFFYPYPAGGHPGWKVVGSVLFLLAITAVVIRHARRHPSLFVGWLWYLVMLLPVAGLVQVGEQAMADRYTYLPLLGIFVAVAWGAPPLLPGGVRRLLPAFGVAAVGVLVPLAQRQAFYWRDNPTIFAHAVAVNPENAQAVTNLRLLQYPQSTVDERPDDTTAAALPVPADPVALYNMGNYHFYKGEPEKAVPLYLKALELDPSLAEAYNNLGSALFEMGDRETAAVAFAHAVRQRPDYAEAIFNHGAVLIELGRTDEGRAQKKRAVELDPRLAGREPSPENAPASR